MEEERDDIKVIHLKNKTVVLKLEDFSGEIDVEELLQVDYNNIIGDIITFPVLFNRIARLKAEAESLLEEIKFDFDKWEAEQYSLYEKQLTREVTNSRSTKTEVPTKTQVMTALIQTKEYRVKRFQVIDASRALGIIDALYQSAKSKDKKLDSISMKLQPQEFENKILEGTINDVLIRIHRNDFPERR